MPRTSPHASNDSKILEQHKTAAVVGAGVIGISWTALFLAHGLRVRVYDPRPDLESAIAKGVQQAAATLKSIGLPADDLTRNLSLQADLARAVEGADVIQENGTEDLPTKQKIFAELERHAPAHALLLSSSSTLRATDIGREMRDASRMLIGHPFNPPHLVPLVEVVPGERTHPDAVARAVAFYTALGKKPTVLRKEIAGFVANRLQAVLLGECIYLVSMGVVTEEELDDIVTNSIGLRWAAAGPFHSFHLGGGPGGLRHFLQHIGPPFERIWKQSGDAVLDEPTMKLLSEQAESAFGSRSHEEMGSTRDRNQLAILKALRETAQAAAKD